jgi:hypothetical protein
LASVSPPSIICTALDALVEPWRDAVSQAWTIKDGEGRVLPCFTGASRLEVECKVVSARYDAFRLHVSSSYREMFARDLANVLTHKGWRVVRTRNSRRVRRAATAQLELRLS